MSVFLHIGFPQFSFSLSILDTSLKRKSIRFKFLCIHFDFSFKVGSPNFVLFFTSISQESHKLKTVCSRMQMRYDFGTVANVKWLRSRVTVVGPSDATYTILQHKNPTKNTKKQQNPKMRECENDFGTCKWNQIFFLWMRHIFLTLKKFILLLF